MSEQQSTCFNCGRSVGFPPQLNRLENGLPCPTCRDRVLDFLPPILPGPGAVLPESELEKREGVNGLTKMSPIYDIGPDEPA
jgi:DNA-directed RNA polymerase subunit RPC12/RpoP